MIDAAVGLVDSMLASSGAETVLGIGVSLAAPVGIDGVVLPHATLPDWAGFDFAGGLRERVGLPVVVDNDANAGALGEHRFGAGQGCADMLYVRLSAGIGAGLIVGHRLYRGASGIAGELGHISLRDHGPICDCGNRGCAEALASPPAVVAELDGFEEFAAVVAAARAGDRRARRAIADAGVVAGQTLAAAINLFNPGRVVVGGDLAAAGELVMEPLAAAVDDRALPAARAATRLALGELGDRAELLGAATLNLPNVADSLVKRVLAA